MNINNFLILEFLSKNNAFNEKSLKSSVEESRINYFRMALLRHLVEKLIFNDRRNVLVIHHVLQSKVSKHTYKACYRKKAQVPLFLTSTMECSNFFFLNFEFFHQTRINQTKVKNMLKTISRRLKFLNLIKLGAS